MKKIALSLLLILILLVAGFFILNNYIYSEKQGDGGGDENLSNYFQERMTTLAVEDIGMPIEGFDAQTLDVAYPGLLPTDFSGVETLGGRYTVEGGGLTFEPNEEMPASSAERTISDFGYARLLDNLSARMGFPVIVREDVDQLIGMINTGEHIEAKIDEGASALGVKIIPHEVLEDSRCPAEVQCIQAGTVRARATLESGLGSANQVFELDRPITTEAEEVTLIRVDPMPRAGERIEPDEYVFYFTILKR